MQNPSLAAKRAIRFTIKQLLARAGYRYPEKHTSPLAKCAELLHKACKHPIEAYTYIDVGANIGQGVSDMSMIAKRYSAHTYIYAFEPVLSNYQQLAKLDENRFTTMKLFQAGLSDTNRQAMINLASDSMWHSVENNATWEGLGGKSELINLWTLDDVFETMTLTANVILKIDIEGHELAFLRGAESFLRNQKADFIIIEIGFNPEDKQHTYFPVVCDNLMDKGYRCIDLMDVCSYKHPDWGGALSIGYANAIFCRNTF